MFFRPIDSGGLFLLLIIVVAWGLNLYAQSLLKRFERNYQLKREGKKLYYLDEQNERVWVEKIVNRVIFDELIHYKDLKREFFFSEECDVEWIGHPSWFFRISSDKVVC